MLRTKSIYDIPLRVTYYARVSSETDEQLNSLDNQVSYYEEFIKRNAKWSFVAGYVDEGISGISTKHRENFNRMIDDAADDNFDLVITRRFLVSPEIPLTRSNTRGSFYRAEWACSFRMTTSTHLMRIPS